ncbi:hypothetical protein Pla175_40860 [Pirellulimonas nuda]|uniref:Uncharacterized protein n=1 Tax=Pirellulimonas nuda TaxID=2528009 RepID=A0A518DGT3_9BACT|nr:hypothetical protein [Pirellulimonas nuda]QDU90677.1 hypothetical protein Pla175_40860 [Pirellulimonas nuda]
MSKHQHGGHDSHSHSAKRRAPHKDVRLWIAVALMLAAMVAYVMTMDESEIPGEAPGPEVPAAL